MYPHATEIKSKNLCLSISISVTVTFDIMTLHNG